MNAEVTGQQEGQHSKLNLSLIWCERIRLIGLLLPVPLNCTCSIALSCGSISAWPRPRPSQLLLNLRPLLECCPGLLRLRADVAEVRFGVLVLRLQLYSLDVVAHCPYPLRLSRTTSSFACTTLRI